MAIPPCSVDLRVGEEGREMFIGNMDKLSLLNALSNIYYDNFMK